MPWFKLDDAFPMDPKILGVSPSARLLFVVGIAYCSNQRTDGTIPADSVPLLHFQAGSTDSACDELVRVGLWEHRPEGYGIVTYLKHQKPRAQIERETEAKSARQRKWRENRDGDVDASTGESRDASATPPDTPTPTDTPTDRPTPSSNSLTLVRTDTAETDPVIRIYNAWAATIDGPRKLTNGRRAKIRARLKSWSADDLAAAVTGWQHDEWPDRRQHNDLTILLRNDEQVEKFLELARRGPQPKMNATTRNNLDTLARVRARMGDQP